MYHWYSISYTNYSCYLQLKGRWQYQYSTIFFYFHTISYSTVLNHYICKTKTDSPNCILKTLFTYVGFIHVPFNFVPSFLNIHMLSKIPIPVTFLIWQRKVHKLHLLPESKQTSCFRNRYINLFHSNQPYIWKYNRILTENTRSPCLWYPSYFVTCISIVTGNIKVFKIGASHTNFF